ncbi:MAG: UDP-N-acetylmuramoyl-L-alanyl-D-glutamate--2,6-diaminopimelate ligase [Bacteroidetes bacterium]|nr:MAG: UDP-N-acetylmuramoyl-L-alanyl-D-glutamate--2,6-diaminopimelate ligase [Bacteroidota bacterium]
MRTPTPIHEIRELLGNPELRGPDDILVEEVVFDSRKVRPGCIFVAVTGTQVDGHLFIPQVLAAGVRAVVLERWPIRGKLPENVAFLKVPNSREALARLAAFSYGYPARELKLVGITGTNGKTTVAHLLHGLFQGLGYKAGLISTVTNKVGRIIHDATLTTPDPLTLNALLREMVDAGCAYAFMEVSSHAIDQRRIAGLDFVGGVFTNITHDHLDYHKTFKKYIATKKQFFDNLPAEAFALTNLDDRRGSVMVQNTRARVVTYALRNAADYRARILENTFEGLKLQLDGYEFHSPLVGAFNAYNLLAAYATARLLDQPPVETLSVLSALPTAEGRLQRLLHPKGKIIGIVDYAHSPDALEKVLKTLREILGRKGRVLTVVGCGGDRDKAKRPKMAAIAAKYSEQVFLTSDNPRSEDPAAILRDMESGLSTKVRKRVLTIADRREAIRAAAQMARRGDIVLVAGKGHEKYQEIKGQRLPFDDKAELMQAFREAAEE